MNDIKLMPEKYDRKKQKSSGFKLSSESVSQLSEKLLLKGGFFFILSLIFLILVVLAVVGLWAYKQNLVKEGESLVAQTENLRSQRDIEFENKLMDLKEKIEGTKGILKNRIYSSLFFAMLEELVLPQVQFVGLSSDLNKGTVILKTEASDFDSLTKQLVAFEEDERVKNVSVSSVRLEESGKVGSDLSLELKPSVIYEQ